MTEDRLSVVAGVSFLLVSLALLLVLSVVDGV
jgi:hypothetical protein